MMNLTKIHPLTYIIYYLLLIVLAFMFNNPYYIATFIICISILLVLQGVKSEFKGIIQLFIPFAIIIALLNPITCKEGITRIYLFGSYFITVEALVYGILMSLSFLLVILTFTAYNNSVTYQDMLYVFSKKFPNISMIIVMALRFIPLLNTRISETRKISKLSHHEDYTFIEQIKQFAQNIGVVVSFSLEEAMVTAKSMKSRGYNVAERTSYLIYKFRTLDIILLTIIVVCLIISIIGFANGYGSITIYPSINFSFSNLPLNIYYLAFVVLLLPLIYLELREKIQWH
ncbi:MAG: energy-coupling factor transporter transmembrane component T [Methanobacteriaceae archaeon]|nr:energy-coupling factor transporter transmembrane component T [Methanobacteriaceae archaeon]